MLCFGDLSLISILLIFCDISSTPFTTEEESRVSSRTARGRPSRGLTACCYQKGIQMFQKSTKDRTHSTTIDEVFLSSAIRRLFAEKEKSHASLFFRFREATKRNQAFLPFKELLVHLLGLIGLQLCDEQIDLILQSFHIYLYIAW